MKIHSIVKCIGETAFGFSIFHEVWSQDIEIRFRGPQFYFPICRWHEQQKCETKTKSISKNAQNFLASWILIRDSPARFYLTLNFRCRNFFFKVDHRTKFWKQKRSVMPKLAPEFWFQVFSSKDLEKNEKIPKPFLDSFSSVKVAALRNFATRGQLITPNQSLTIW